MTLILLTALDVKASNDVLGSKFQYEGSRIWYLATHSWVYVITSPSYRHSLTIICSLPPYALALAIEQGIELVRVIHNETLLFLMSVSKILLYLAGRSYKQSGFHIFFRKTNPETPYASTNTFEPADMDPGESKMQPLLNAVYDPYTTNEIPYDSYAHRIVLNSSIERAPRRSDSEDEKGSGSSSVVPPPPGLSRFGGTRPHRGYRRLSSDSSIQPLISGQS